MNFLKPWMHEKLEDIIGQMHWWFSMALEHGWAQHDLVKLPETGKWEHELGGGWWNGTQFEVVERRHRVFLTYAELPDGRWSFKGEAVVFDPQAYELENEGNPEGVTILENGDAELKLDFTAYLRVNGFAMGMWVADILKEWYLGQD